MQKLMFVGLLLLPLLSACVTNPDKALPTSVANLESIGGHSIRGRITLGEYQGLTRLFIDLTGLTGEHGFHIHEEADCRRALANLSKGHFNPEGKPHGEHLGDMMNIKSDVYGTFRGAVFNKAITLEGKNSVVGHALIITARADDYTTQPDGRSGQAIACGVIEPL